MESAQACKKRSPSSLNGNPSTSNKSTKLGSPQQQAGSKKDGAAALWRSNAETLGNLIVPFLGIRSLVNFSSMNKTTNALVGKEVVRRKGLVADIEAKLTELLDPTSSSNANVWQAHALRQNALSQIDDELDWQPWFENHNAYAHIYNQPPRDAFFHEERQKFLNKYWTDEEPADYRCSSLSMLPIQFYLNPFDDADETSARPMPTQEQLDSAYGVAYWIWVAEDHMQSSHELTFCDPYFFDRQNPLAIFHDDIANSFFVGECVPQAAVQIIASPAMFYAFQVVAREMIGDIHKSQDTLHYTLERALSMLMSRDEENDWSENDLKSKE